MNDPNGVIQWEGQFHLFYQYNPDGAYHDNMHWGHAVSDDLIHWEDLPIALAPTPGTVDEGGIFSGCAVNNNGVPTIFYTGVDRGAHVQVQCMATGNDDLTVWSKYDGNPVIASVPEESGQTQDFRDPFVWQDDDTWYMVVGSQVSGIGGAAFLYRSDDLKTWEYLNPLLVGDKTKSGVIWECPNFFPIGDKWVLIVSTHTGVETGTVFYFVGTYKDHRFHPEQDGILDHGYLYAPLTLQANDGRRLLWGWLREGRTLDAHKSAGWAGAQSVPRVLSLDAQNRLIMQPAEELEILREPAVHLADQTLNASMQLPVRGQSLDIVADISLDEDGDVTLSVLCGEEDGQQVDIYYDAAAQQLHVRRDGLATDSDEAYPIETEHTLAAGEPLSLRVLVDASIVEIIANGRTSITTRVYPTRFDQDGVRIRGRNATIRELDVYNMQTIWPTSAPKGGDA